MGNEPSRPVYEPGSFDPRTVRPPPAAPAAGVLCVCPGCQTLLNPPAAVFKCPTCHITIQLPSAAAPGPQGAPGAVWAPGTTGATPGSPALDQYVRQMQLGAGAPFVRPGPRAAPSPLEMRVRSVLQQLPPTHPSRAPLEMQLQHIPRGPDGSANPRALSELEAQANAALRGASEGTINNLPTRAFKKPVGAAAAALDEEHLNCAVCMSSYDDDEILRTLPCLHSFHRDCVDQWLRTNKLCPLCKTPIDVTTRRL